MVFCRADVVQFSRPNRRRRFVFAPEFFCLKLRRVLHPFIHWIEAKGAWAPWLFVALFLVASFLMIWRLEAMSGRGFEGTILGTLVMPYCSGMGNLIFAFILGRSGGSGAEVMTNSLVNNVTNMTLVLGLPAVLWGMNVLPKKKPDAGKKKNKSGGSAPELHRLALLLTLLAVGFFTGAVWALGRKGRLDFNDGLVLIGLFFFWQCFHVFEVLKSNARQGKSVFGLMLLVDLALLAAGAYAIYVSTDRLVAWISNIHHGFISVKHLGWLSGWLMVLPNAVLAFYYAWRKQPEVVYASQVGDAHVSIPLCLGVFALYHPMTMPPFFHTGMVILLGATLVHFLFIAMFGKLPRLAGLALVGSYGYFLWKGLLG
jgi:cation:H+ antiporter